MTDIVEHLRSHICYDPAGRCLYDQAADEIERLRRSNAQLFLALDEHVSTPACSLTGRRKRWWRRAT